MAGGRFVIGPVRYRFWELIAAGLSVRDAAPRAGMSRQAGDAWFSEAGGVNPRMAPPGSGGRLSITEREEIAVLRASGLGVRQIARTLGRAPSTISRELRRGTARRDPGYRAVRAQYRADARARRPKQRKLVTSPRLAAEVQDRLAEGHSPEQIAQRLILDFPDDPEMRVSHETIYRALYVQGRGGLRRELAACLRTGRALRKPRNRSTAERRGHLPDMVMIAERPPEVADRAVPGHWEGDLILGSTASGSAIGTLVERTTGFVLLLHLPERHTADAVAEAMVAKISHLPETLRRTLTWDQGSEMANHIQIAEATGIDIYFCDPHSPWQRGTNENTNGLLRQYFAKGRDLSIYDPDYLDFIAARLNNRPRKRHQWSTPAEVLDRLLSQPNPNVAFTA